MADSQARAGRVLERRDVWLLSRNGPWEPTIEWYARAVGAMQARDGRDFADPFSWRHMAEIHGTSIARSSWPRGARWNECEHSSWYFLPWHRIYLHHFEKAVRATVAALGGPQDWALPYWDYGDPRRPETRKLPPAFREPKMSDGSRNPLFVAERGPRMNVDGEVPAVSTSVRAAFRERVFAEAPGLDMIAGFGGPPSGRNHGGGPVGGLESTPHGSVHVAVGGVQPPGFMSRFETAARDPIFWLHHANIDRQWEAWLQLGGGRANPDDQRWLRLSFEFGSGSLTTRLRVRDVLDTTAPPLSYRYGDMPALAPQEVAVAAGVASEGRREEGGQPPMADRPPPQLVGATDAPVPLSDTTSVARVPVDAPPGPQGTGLMAGDRARRVFLRLENVTGSRLSAASYLVHVNLPDGADPTALEDLEAGQVSMFGVVESSRNDEAHSGSGLTFAFDITDIVARLEASGDWDPERLRVSLTPVPDSAGQVHPGDVSVGRISLYYQ